MTQSLNESALEAFEAFRKRFPYTKVTVHSDCMVYGIRNRNLAGTILKEARQLVDLQKLPLSVDLYDGIYGASIVVEPVADMQYFREWQLKHYAERFSEAKEVKEKAFLRDQLYRLKQPAA